MKKPKKLLITGGSGDLGRVLSKRAVAAGFEVTATYYSRPDRITAGNPIRLDLGDHAAVAGVLEHLRPDAIVHAALNAVEPPRQIVEATSHLKDYADRQTGARLILLSSDMVFDGTAAPYRDDDPPSPLSAYGEAKAALEASGGCVVRTSLIYDFEPGNRQVDWMLHKIAAGEPCRLYWDEYRSPIWGANLADALLELVNGDSDGILNIAGPERMSRLELGEGILRALDCDSHIERVSREGTGRPRDLTLDVSKAQRLLRTPLLRFEEARRGWQSERI